MHRSFAATLRRGNRITRGQDWAEARLGSLVHDPTGLVNYGNAHAEPEPIKLQCAETPLPGFTVLRRRRKGPLEKLIL